MKLDVDAIGNPSPAELAALGRELEFVPTVNRNPGTLTPDQVRRFNEFGHLLPFDGLDATETSELRRFFDRILAEALARGDSSYSINTAHLRFGEIHDLMRHPRIIAPVKDLLGDDLVGWGAHFFCKLPQDGKRVPWHQDCIYWPLTPARTVTVWLAIDDATPANANMRFVPRSHLHGPIDFDVTDSANDVLNLSVENAAAFGDAPVDATLSAGQFSLHSDLLLHGSEANRSDRRRCGLTLRYAAAAVRAHHGWNRKGIVVAGRDPDKHWLNAPRPE